MKFLLRVVLPLLLAALLAFTVAYGISELRGPKSIKPLKPSGCSQVTPLLEASATFREQLLTGRATLAQLETVKAAHRDSRSFVEWDGEAAPEAYSRALGLELDRSALWLANGVSPTEADLASWARLEGLLAQGCSRRAKS